MNELLIKGYKFKILIPACVSSSPAFLMMYSAYKLNKQVTIYSLDVLLSQFGASPLFHAQFCCFLTCIQVYQEAGKLVWHSYLLKNFPQFVVIHTVKGFSIGHFHHWIILEADLEAEM